MDPFKTSHLWPKLQISDTRPTFHLWFPWFLFRVFPFCSSSGIPLIFKLAEREEEHKFPQTGNSSNLSNWQRGGNPFIVGFSYISSGKAFSPLLLVLTVWKFKSINWLGPIVCAAPNSCRALVSPSWKLLKLINVCGEGGKGQITTWEPWSQCHKNMNIWLKFDCLEILLQTFLQNSVFFARTSESGFDRCRKGFVRMWSRFCGLSCKCLNEFTEYYQYLTLTNFNIKKLAKLGWCNS